jgi:ADP-ribose pyrophosphatase YjhB (NUDIX family)
MDAVMPFLERRATGKDGRPRLVCSKCDLVVYENPKIIVGSVIADGDALVLCQRAIEPGAGLWTIPSGYFELGEDLEQGARREALEEAGLEIETEGVLAIYSSTKLREVQIFFRARPIFAGYVPGPETTAMRFFDWEELPWSSLAFPSVAAVLRVWHEKRQQPLPQIIVPIDD